MVNMKTLFGSLKSALSSSDGKQEAAILAAIEQGDVAGLYAALPQTAQEIWQAWFKQIKAIDVQAAGHINTIVVGQVAELDVECHVSQLEAIYNVFSRPLDDFSSFQSFEHIRLLPTQPMNLLYRLQWHRLSLQGKIEANFLKKVLSIWQYLAHQHSSYNRHSDDVNQFWQVSLQEFTQILPLQCTAAFGEQGGNLVEPISLAALLRLYPQYDWHKHHLVLDYVFERSQSLDAIERITDLDEWLMQHRGAIKAWYQDHGYYQSTKLLLQYASSHTVLHLPLLPLWVMAAQDKDVDNRMLGLGILRQLDVNLVGEEMSKAAELADKPAAVLGKLAEVMPNLGEAYAPVLQAWLEQAKTAAAKKPFALALSKLTLNALVQKTEVTIPDYAPLDTDLPKDRLMGVIQQNITEELETLVNRIDWCERRLRDYEQANTAELDPQELQWHQHGWETEKVEYANLQAQRDALRHIGHDDYTRWYEALQNRKALPIEDLRILFQSQRYYYAHNPYVLNSEHWRPAHTAAQFGLWNTQALIHSAQAILNTHNWLSIQEHFATLGRTDSAALMWQVVDEFYLGDERWQQAWSFVAKNQQQVEEALGLQAFNTRFNKLSVDDVLVALHYFPVIPTNLQHTLAVWAYGSNRALRERAQALLSKQTNALDWAAWGLNNDHADTRKISIAWLIALQDGSSKAIDLLHQRLNLETESALRVQILQGLIALNADVSAYLSEEALLKEVAPILSKKRGKAIEWLAWEELPELYWQDKRPVNPELIEGWLRLALQMKDANGDGLWQLYMGLLDEDSQQRFSLFVLKQFVDEDTRPMTDAELNELIDKEVPKKLKKFQKDYEQYPNYYSEYKDITEADVRAKLTAELGRYNEKQTALPYKGLLALTGKVAADEWYRTFRRYQRDFAYKTKQLGALVQAAAAGENVAVLPLIASLDVKASGNYIRTLARNTIGEFQQRHELSDEQMADFLVPDFGMDAFSRLSLNYGERAFTVRLLDDGEWQISDVDGKVLRTLPPVRKTEDENWVKALKAQFASIKKDAKASLKAQQQRLLVAMLTERQWSGKVWQQVIAKQPLMRVLAQKLVWKISQDGGCVYVRLDEQGELLDSNDDIHSLNSDARVSVAHGVDMTEEEIQAWQQHFADYQVTPLFNQFRPKSTHSWLRNQVSDYQDYALPYYTLRSVVAKHGFDVGSYDYYGEDGFHFNLGNGCTISIYFEAQSDLGYGADRSKALVWLNEVKIHSDEPATERIKAEAFAAYQAVADASNGKDLHRKKSA